MKALKKSIVALVCLFACVCNSVVSDASAIDNRIDNGICGVDSINSTLIKCDLSIESGTAIAYGKVKGKSGTSKIEIILYLEKKNKNASEWSEIKKWNVSSKSNFASIEKSIKLTSKGTYRCRMETIVTKDGLSEISTCVSGSKTY